MASPDSAIASSTPLYRGGRLRGLFLLVAVLCCGLVGCVAWLAWQSNFTEPLCPGLPQPSPHVTDPAARMATYPALFAGDSLLRCVWIELCARRGWDLGACQGVTHEDYYTSSRLVDFMWAPSAPSAQQLLLQRISSRKYRKVFVGLSVWDMGIYYTSDEQWVATMRTNWALWMDAARAANTTVVWFELHRVWQSKCALVDPAVQSLCMSGCAPEREHFFRTHGTTLARAAGAAVLSTLHLCDFDELTCLDHALDSVHYDGVLVGQEADVFEEFMAVP